MSVQRNSPITVCQLLIELHVGGGEVLAARIGRRLSGSYRIVFVCLQELGRLGEELRAEGFAVHALGKRPGIDRRAMGRLRALLREERVDLVHAHHYGSFFYAAGARLPAGRPAIVLTEHGRPFPDEPQPGHRLANRLLLRKSDRVVGVGNAVRRALINVEGFPARRVEVVYNGIDLAAFSELDVRCTTACPPRARPCRRGLCRLPGGATRLAQGPRDAAAGPGAPRRRPAAPISVRLVLVGVRDRRNRPSRSRSSRLDLSRHVLRLGLRSDVPRLLQAADAVLLTSLNEGIPLTLIEAMAARLPVVATRVGGVPEVVEEGQTGLLAPSGDDEALAEQILRLAADAPLRQQMGAQGRERALALFAEDRMVAAYDRLYSEVLGEARTEGRLPAALSR